MRQPKDITLAAKRPNPRLTQRRMTIWQLKTDKKKSALDLFVDQFKSHEIIDRVRKEREKEKKTSEEKKKETLDKVASYFRSATATLKRGSTMLVRSSTGVDNGLAINKPEPPPRGMTRLEQQIREIKKLKKKTYWINSDQSQQIFGLLIILNAILSGSVMSFFLSPCRNRPFVSVGIRKLGALALHSSIQFRFFQ